MYGGDIYGVGMDFAKFALNDGGVFTKGAVFNTNSTVMILDFDFRNPNLFKLFKQPEDYFENLTYSRIKSIIATDKIIQVLGKDEIH